MARKLTDKELAAITNRAQVNGWTVQRKPFEAIVTFRRGLVISAPPHLQWAIGGSVYDFVARCERSGWRIIDADLATREEEKQPSAQTFEARVQGR